MDLSWFHGAPYMLHTHRPRPLDSVFGPCSSNKKLCINPLPLLKVMFLWCSNVIQLGCNMLDLLLSRKCSGNAA